MIWVIWLLLGWFALSVVAALAFGCVIRARDHREKPHPLQRRNDDPWRSAS